MYKIHNLADNNTLEQIRYIKSISSLKGNLYTNTKLYSLNPEYHKYFQEKEYNLPYKVEFYFWKDNDNYLKGMQYRTPDTFFWEWESIDNFIKILNGELRLGLNSLKFKIEQWQGYDGVEKLKKPVELKGINPFISVDMGDRKKQLFIKEGLDDMWIKDLGYETYCTVSEKIEYPHKQTVRYFNTQAWIKVENILELIKSDRYFRVDIVKNIVGQEQKVRRQMELKSMIPKVDNSHTVADITMRKNIWSAIVGELYKYINNNRRI